MRTWPVVPLADICQIVGGGTPTRTNPDYFGSDVPWVTPKDMKVWDIRTSQVGLTKLGLEKSAARLVPSGSVLIVVRSGVLKHSLPVGIARVPVAVNQDMKALLPRPDADPNYLGRYIRWRSDEILKWVRATTADNFSVEKLKQLLVPLPPLREQRRLAEILDRADMLRTKRLDTISRVDCLTQSFFVDAFGDPAVNPRGWPVTDIGSMLAGAAYGTSEKAAEAGAFPVLRMNNITYDGAMDFSDLKYMDLPENKIERYTVRDGDILFNRTNSAELVGKTAVFRGEDSQMAYAGYLVRLRVSAENSPDYISHFLNSRHGKAVLRNLCKSIIGMANINAREVQAIRIPRPPTELQLRFAMVIRRIQDERSRLYNSLASLNSLFTSVQARAFAGEL